MISPVTQALINRAYAAIGEYIAQHHLAAQRAAEAASAASLRDEAAASEEERRLAAVAAREEAIAAFTAELVVAVPDEGTNVPVMTTPPDEAQSVSAARRNSIQLAAAEVASEYGFDPASIFTILVSVIKMLAECNLSAATATRLVRRQGPLVQGLLRGECKKKFPKGHLAELAFEAVTEKAVKTTAADMAGYYADLPK